MGLVSANALLQRRGSWSIHLRTMPAIKNWSKVDDETYEYDPDPSITVELKNHGHSTHDGRHSLWYGDLYDGSTQLKQVVEGATTKRRARRSLVRWLRENPHLDIETLREEVSDE